MEEQLSWAWGQATLSSGLPTEAKAKGSGRRPFRKLLWPWGLKGSKETGWQKVGQ